MRRPGEPAFAGLLLLVWSMLVAPAAWAQTTSGTHVNYEVGKEQRKEVVKLGARKAFGRDKATREAARQAYEAEMPPPPTREQARSKAWLEGQPLGLAAPSAKAEAEKKMAGEQEGQQEAEQPPQPTAGVGGTMVVDGVLLVPARTALTPMGAEVQWQQRAGRGVLYYQGVELIVWPGRAVAEIDGRTVSVQPAARVSGGALLVPANLIGQAFGIEPVSAGGRTTFVIAKKLRWSPFGRRPAWPVAPTAWCPFGAPNSKVAFAR